MPLTLSHPAIVLPLSRAGLPLSALVIGSMSPDVPVFLPSFQGYALSHTLLGIVTLDLGLALLALCGWNWFLRDALVDLSPAMIRARVAPLARLSRRQWALAPLAVCLGSLSHLGWDAFTHAGRWGVDHVAWLQAAHYGVPGYTLAQYGCGVLGLLVVAHALVRHLRGLEPRHDPHPSVLHPMLAPSVVAVATVFAVVMSLARVSDGLRAMAFHGVVGGVVATAIGMVVTCTAWHTTRHATRLAGRRTAPA